MSAYDRITLKVFDGDSSDLNACKLCEAHEHAANPYADCPHYYACWHAYIAGASDMVSLLVAQNVVDGEYHAEGFATAKMLPSHTDAHNRAREAREAQEAQEHPVCAGQMRIEA